MPHNVESFEYFCQVSSKSILIISCYTGSKLVRFGFFETQCVMYFHIGSFSLLLSSAIFYASLCESLVHAEMPSRGI